MKETIVSILEQRMYKCTSLQFWAVGALTGLNVFVVSQKKRILAVLPSWAILLVIAVATLYGAFYIIHWHTNYYLYRSEQAKLLQNEQDVPNFMKVCPHKWKGSSLIGVVFYVGWVLGMGLISFIVYL